ncbi:MAG: hypothetical protein ACP5E3_15910, partial [Bacteroidales bacterium]
SDELVKEQTVGLQISILQGSESGTAVYTETQTPSTNINGMVSIEIGDGVSSDDFSMIDWGAGPYFIKTEIDPAGGNSYTITSSSQLLSVPYSLHAKSAEMVSGEMIKSVSFPANSLAITPGGSIITPNVYGLQWQQNYRNAASLTLKKPAEYTGGDVELSLFFMTSTDTEGIVNFFIRPNSFSSGDGLTDIPSIKNDGVKVNGKEGFGTLYEQTFIIPADRFEKDWWRIAIQREGSNSTYTDDVMVMSVALTYH